MAEEKREGKINDWLEDDEYAIVIKSDVIKLQQKLLVKLINHE